MTDKIIYTIFLIIAALAGGLVTASPVRVLRIVSRSAKIYSSMNITVWRILGALVPIGCIVKLVGMWIFGWNS
jgi:hypothetical protein